MSFDIAGGFENSSAPLGQSLVGAAAAFLDRTRLYPLAHAPRSVEAFWTDLAYYCWAVGAAALGASYTGKTEIMKGDAQCLNFLEPH